MLKEIEDEYIDLIYCDILYGTGRNFGDYQDLKADKEIINEHYILRFREMYRVLKDTGSIYIHCDWRINHWIRNILDNIFGYHNFRNEIIWSYERWTNSSRDFVRCHDTILRYTKSDDYIFNKLYEEFSPKSKHKGSRFSVLNESNKLEQEYVSNERLKAMGDVWSVSILNSQAKERTGYVTQKPKELIKRIIKSSSNEGDVVADFYMGSGTTIEVAKELGRNYIGCDISPRSIDITKDRLINIS